MTSLPIPSPFLTIPQEHSFPSRSSSPSVFASPQASPTLSSSRSASPLSPSSAPHLCPAEQQLRSSVALHQEFQQQMRHHLAQKDHPLHISDPEAVQRYQQQLVTQLEYYRQMQIMHSQRVRDIELLHLQQQQNHRPRNHHPQPLHVIKRLQLAQRMLQMQKLYHAYQIQKIQYLQKLNRLQETPLFRKDIVLKEQGTAGTLDKTTVELKSAEDMAKLEIDPSTMHIPLEAASRPRLDLQELFEPVSDRLPTSMSPSSGMPPGIQELARIVLPNSDQIRKLRHQRLKYHARLRQAAAARAHRSTNINTQACATLQSCSTADQKNQTTLDSAPEVSPSVSETSPITAEVESTTLTTLASTLSSSMSSCSSASSPAAAVATVATTPESQMAKQIGAAVWTSSTTSVIPRSIAELTYKRQLRHSMALQQHMIQDHTHRYRVFQAFCLLQRAREAQVVDEMQSQKHKQLHTLAWVEALRHSKELEIPQ